MKKADRGVSFHWCYNCMMLCLSNAVNCVHIMLAMQLVEFMTCGNVSRKSIEERRNDEWSLNKETISQVRLLL